MLDKKKLLKIGTLNENNIETNKAYASELLTTYDLLAVQEHWLFSFQLSNFEAYFTSHFSFSKAVDADDPLPPTQKPRGFGGEGCHFVLKRLRLHRKAVYPWLAMFTCLLVIRKETQEAMIAFKIA